MQDQASLDYALQEQVTWHVFSSPRDSRRKAFDESCKKWDKWVARQERRARIAQRQLQTRNGENGIASSTSPDSIRKRSSSRDLLSETLNGNNSSTSYHGPEDLNGGRSSLKNGFSYPSSIPFSPSSLPPHKRMSRAIRVFVAWKDRSPTSPVQAVTTFNGVGTPSTSNSFRG